MNRRGFIGSILALGVAPAIVRADSLMQIVPREMLIAYGDLDEFRFTKGVARYTYTVNMPIVEPDWREGIMRVWADDKLIWERFPSSIPNFP